MFLTKRNRWPVAAGLGLALAVVLTPLAVMSRPGPDRGDVVTAALVIGPAALGLSWLALVAGPALVRFQAEGNVERAWLERALAGTAVDVLGGTAVAALVLATNDIEAPAGPALTVVLAAGLADLALRYLRLHRS